MAPPIALVVYSRDRHPPNHCSFREQGGPWPIHCVDGSPGFQFHPELVVVTGALIVDKATGPEQEAYSDFQATGLAEQLRARQIKRCVVTGLATEYCVKATVLDALREGFDTCVLTDAIAAVDVHPGDGDRALLEMRSAGAVLSDSGQIATMLRAYPKPTALLIVDVQNDFFPGGALPVADAHRILGPLHQVLQLRNG